MKMKSLEQYLRENVQKGAIDHIIRASVDSDGLVTFYIHPHGVDGDTLDFSVDGNQLHAMQAEQPDGTVLIQR